MAISYVPPKKLSLLAINEYLYEKNESNEVERYKVRLVAQGFSQRPSIDFDQTYSPIIDGITFCYLISLAVKLNLEMQLMDVVTAYSYGSLDDNNYMKIPDGFKIPQMRNDENRSMYNIKLQRSLYGLKQLGRMWYNRLNEFLLKKEYINNEAFPSIYKEIIK